MASRNAQLADAVKAALNTAAAAEQFNATFVALRRAVPQTDLAKLKTLTVSVIAGGDASDRTSRDTNEHEMTVLIGIEKQVTSDPTTEAANAEVDPLMELVEQIEDFFGPATIDPTQWFFQSAAIRTLTDVNSLLQNQVFRGVVAATYLVAT